MGLHSHLSQRLSMKKENRSGPSIDPRGTAASMEAVYDDWPDKTTLNRPVCQVTPNPSKKLFRYSSCHEF